MKELSTEQKAKAYDKVSKEVKDFFEGRQKMYNYVTKTLEHLFPELKESEDERIRKQLIEHTKWSYDEQEISEEEKERWISWLEKQGEQKAKIADFKAKDWYVSKVDGKIYNAKFMEEPLTNQKRRLEIEKAAMSATGIIEQEEWFIKGAEWSDKNPFCISSEKQGEQKPYGQREECFDCQFNYAGECKGSCQMKRDEQNPAWSEEDNIILSRIIADYERSNEEWFNAQKSLPHGMKITWLKSLKDRVFPQLKQEWSEEDVVKINRIVACLENLNVADNDILLKDVDWLKSLRPQKKRSSTTMAQTSS